MNRDIAKRITDDYFKAWIERDKELFLSLLDPNVVINECTGDSYLNKVVAGNWFKGWHEEGNHVLSWDINECFFDKSKEVASAIWRFVCVYKGQEYSFDGVTMIRFNENKIISLDEYQMEVIKKYPYSE